MSEVRWLTDAEQRAWQALLVLFLRGLPEVERTLKADGLLAVQYGVFVALSVAPGRTLGLSELADNANMSQSRLSHRLHDLIASGDIEITPDPRDRRAKRATLTAQGMHRLEELAPIHADDVRRVFFDRLDESQTAALADALSTIAADICDRGALTATRAEHGAASPPSSA
jgi:DNA-binding MarR family transcriptional regulator